MKSINVAAAVVVVKQKMRTTACFLAGRGVGPHLVHHPVGVQGHRHVVRDDSCAIQANQINWSAKLGRLRVLLKILKITLR